MMMLEGGGGEVRKDMKLAGTVERLVQKSRGSQQRQVVLCNALINPMMTKGFF